MVHMHRHTYKYILLFFVKVLLIVAWTLIGCC